MKIGVCGVWHVHARDYVREAREAGHEILGVFDENADMLAEFAKTYEIKPCGSLDELLALDIESVIVCTSTDLHKKYITAIAAAHKNIFTEKVLALNENDCLEIKKAIEKAKVRFAISFPWKTKAGFMKAHELAAAGEIGDVNFMRFRYVHDGSLAGWLPEHFYNKQHCGGGAMIDLGAHGMYLTHWILGMPCGYKSVFTNVTGKPVEDNAVTVMEFRNGAISINETGFVSKDFPITLEIGGSLGRIAVTDNVLICKNGENKIVDAGADAPSPLVQFLGGKIADGCGINEAVALTEMMNKAYQNA